MKLITELNEEIEYLSEAKEDGEKNHYIHGVFLQADVKNRNGRIYPMDVMENEVDRYVKEMVKPGRAFGELGHPAGPQVNLDRVSHIIVELKRDGKNFIGKAKLTDTPMGNIGKGLLKSGAKLGVSSRGMGSLTEKNGVMVVQKDYHIATAADIVADPSAPDAFVVGIMENVEWFYDAVKGTWHEEKMDNVKKNLKRMSITEIEMQKIAILEDFLQSLAVNTRLL